LAFGSNLGNKKENIEKAYNELLKQGIILTKKSNFYRNPAYGIENQPHFINTVAIGETFFTPMDLLNKIKNIEKKIGRNETFRWGPRVIDIDIIFYDNIIYKSDNLEIPHKDYKNRNFVITPAKHILNNEWNIEN